MWAKRQALILLIAAQAGAIGVGAEEAVDPDAALLTRLESIEELLSNQGLLEMLQQMETLEQEVSRMRGELEVQNHVLEQIKKRQRDLYKDIDRRLQRFENRWRPLSRQRPEKLNRRCRPCLPSPIRKQQTQSRRTKRR